MIRTALITGCSRGIGLKIKDLFLAMDYQVIAPNRSELDLADRESVQKFLQGFRQKRIDVLVNNAGENPIKLLPDIDLATWDRIQQINLTSPMMLIQALAPKMAEQNYGRIVNISSIYSGRARAGRGIYSSSKAGLDAITRTAAVEYSAKGVLINSVCPGFIDTELTRKNNSPEQIQKLLERVPFGNLGNTNDVAELVWFLASDKNQFVTGQSWNIDGAFSIA